MSDISYGKDILDEKDRRRQASLSLGKMISESFAKMREDATKESDDE